MRYVVATTVALLAIGLGISGGQTFVRDALAQPGYATWCWASVIFAAIVIIFMWATTIQALTVRKRLLIVAGTVIIEASLNYLIPTLGYPRSVVLSESPVAFLHSHLGLQRFYSFGPLFPNSGSYFGIAELDDLELPVAKSWSNYTAKHLDRLAGQGALLGQHFDQLAENIASYERVATKYVLIRRSNLPDFEAAFRTGTEHPLLAYSDDFLMIYQLPHPSSYFSAPGCVLLADSRERVTAQCTHPTPLVRRELYLPGWSATVNGATKEVSETDEVFQALPLPSGTSSVAFSFVPPFMEFGYASFGLALLALVYQMWEYTRRNSTDSYSSSASATPPPLS
jgi:hypothetical protein